jgi:hypothetical protein
LHTYIADLQKKNPGINVGGLATAANPGTTVASLLSEMDSLLEQNIDSLSNNFGAGKTSVNLTGSYDFTGRLKGWSSTVSARYNSGAYTGAYEVRKGGVASGDLVDTVPIFGNSTMAYDVSLRYRTRFDWLRKTSVSFQLSVFNALNQSSPIIRRVSTAVIAPGAKPPTLGDYTPTSYFLREPRRWQLTSKFDF